MSDQKKELLLRAKAKVAELRAKLAKLKVDLQSSKNAEQDKLEKQIDELALMVKHAGEDFSDSIARKLNDWLK
jgi:uncharacterized membrane protein